MNGTSLIYTIAIASILTVALFSTVPNEAFAQQSLFDYRCYNIDPINTSPPDQGNNKVTLKDQFFPNGVEHTLLFSEEFCNPANKQPKQLGNVIPAFLPHLRCWSIDDPEPASNIEVLVRDQFFLAGRIHMVQEAVEFCHSVDKAPGPMVGATGSQAPQWPGSTGSEDIANWKCYRITDPNVPIPTPNPRHLEDQFTRALPTIPGFSQVVTIGDALKLCTPALKTHGPFTDLPSCAELDPNSNPPFTTCLTISSLADEHMKCYDLNEEDVNPDLPIGLVDQFTDEGNTILSLDKICIAADKDLLIAGTFIPLDSVMILLAGTQMSMAWILPALVATAGIGYGIEIARKYHKDTK